MATTTVETANIAKQRAAAAAKAQQAQLDASTNWNAPNSALNLTPAQQAVSAAVGTPWNAIPPGVAQSLLSAYPISQSTGLPLATVQQMQADPSQAPLMAALGNSINTKNQNQQYVTNNFTPAMVAASTKENLAQQGLQGVATNQSNLAGGLMGGYGAAIGQQQGFANQANAADQASLAGYGQNLGVASGMQAGAYNQLAGTLGGMSQLSATPFSSNVQAQQSAAQLAGYQTSALNTASVSNAALTKAGMQNASYQGYTPDGYSAQQAQYELANTAQADYQKAALQRAGLTQAYSDEGDVNAERSALGQLTNMAGGSLDTTNGAGSGGGSAAQQSALAQYGALTSPEATAKEKFLYEQQREAQEQQEAASRAALMNDYRVRGVGGSGMELASILQSGQQNSQQRLLGDLGTQAGAVDRSMQALAGYGNLSSQMVAQGNQVNQANMANRLGAAGAQGQLAGTIRGQGDALAMGNAGFANQNAEFNANAFNNNQQFNANAYNTNSMFNTGQSNMVGVANMNAYNQANQFNANAVNNSNAFNANANNQAGAFNANAYNSNSQFNAGSYNANQMFNAGQANQNSQFNANANNTNSMFNAGQANQNNQFNANAYNSNQQFNAGLTTQNNQFNAGQVNQTNQFNTAQNGIQSRFADSFAADQQNDAANRAQALANTGITVGQNFAQNSGNAFNAQTGVTNAGYGRSTDVTNLGIAGLTAGYNAGTQANQMQNNVFNQATQNAGSQFNRSLAVGNAWMGNNQTGTTAINSGLNTIAGDNAAKSAAAQVAAGDPGGLLGTGILGKNGILGLKGVPVL